jgi:hypothetical protein
MAKTESVKSNKQKAMAKRNGGISVIIIEKAYNGGGINISAAAASIESGKAWRKSAIAAWRKLA